MAAPRAARHSSLARSASSTDARSMPAEAERERICQVSGGEVPRSIHRKARELASVRVRERACLAGVDQPATGAARGLDAMAKLGGAPDALDSSPRAQPSSNRCTCVRKPAESGAPRAPPSISSQRTPRRSSPLVRQRAPRGSSATLAGPPRQRALETLGDRGRFVGRADVLASAAPHPVAQVVALEQHRQPFGELLVASVPQATAGEAAMLDEHVAAREDERRDAAAKLSSRTIPRLSKGAGARRETRRAGAQPASFVDEAVVADVGVGGKSSQRSPMRRSWRSPPRSRLKRTKSCTSRRPLCSPPTPTRRAVGPPRPRTRPSPFPAAERACRRRGPRAGAQTSALPAALRMRAAEAANRAGELPQQHGRWNDRLVVERRESTAGALDQAHAEVVGG